MNTPHAASQRTILSNTASLLLTTGLTSGLGFAYWWVAARLYPPEVIGLASAAISSMLLLATVGVLGLGTLLIGELRRRPGRAWPLMTTALLVSGITSAALGALFAGLSPRLFPELNVLGSGGVVWLFAGGVMLTALAMVIDQALVGLLRTKFQLLRNAVFSVLKLLALPLGLSIPALASGLGIYANWIGGTLLSMAIFLPQLSRARRIQPDWGLVRELWGQALRHHALNLAVQAPTLALPLLVTSLLGARVNAGFYIAWTLANFVFMIPSHLSTVLYAVGSGEPSALAERLRFTLRVSLLAALLSGGVLCLLAFPLLRLFGTHYTVAATCLQILAAGALPLIIKTHYVALSRIRGFSGVAALTMTFTGALELGLAVLGAQWGGLTGLAIGLISAYSLGALLLSFTVLAVAREPLTAPLELLPATQRGRP